jgi:hypothetical protein
VSNNDDLRRALQVTLAARTRRAMYDGTNIVMVETFELAALLGIPFVRSLSEVSDEGGTADLTEDLRGMEWARQELFCEQDTRPFTP